MVSMLPSVVIRAWYRANQLKFSCFINNTKLGFTLYYDNDRYENNININKLNI